MFEIDKIRLIHLMKEVNPMVTKRLIVFLMVTAFIFGVVSMGVSAQEIKGIVAKIEGDQLTLLDDKGQEKTVKVDEKSLREVKVGDRVLVKDGKVTKDSTSEQSSPCQATIILEV